MKRLMRLMIAVGCVGLAISGIRAVAEEPAGFAAAFWAGKALLSRGEDPERCARREVHEETGHEVRAIRRLGEIYPTPGYNSEIIHLYYADVSAERALHHQGDHDERISVTYLTRREFEQLLGDGQIRDAKTLAAWLFYTNPTPS